MSEFRRDPLSDHWVIIAPNRAHRPEQFTGDAIRIPARCPFCKGHEADTPQTMAAYRMDRARTEDLDWQVRVIPNKFPAVETATPAPPSPHDFFEVRPGFGVHEVIVESPDHVVSLSALRDAQVHLVFHAYQDRLRHWRSDPRLAYAQIFKNSGAAAGASLEHTHSQLIATPVVPTQVQHELTRSLAYHREHGRCAFCVMLAEEVAARTRVLMELRQFVAFCPFASQFPYEVWIVPRNHHSHFEYAEDGELGELAELLRNIVVRMEGALGRPAFNYLIHTAPFDTSSLDHYHWHLELSPRLVKTAGFEWGAGDYINTVAPETAATVLRRGS
jgi:UDPglucose--hexose-1-phosphate uridylyltransferase